MDGEHPKSAVLRIIAQNKDPTNKVTINQSNFEHEFVRDGNKNYFFLNLTITVDGIHYSIKSNKYLNKSSAEHDAFSQALKIINTQSLSRLSAQMPVQIPVQLRSEPINEQSNCNSENKNITVKNGLTGDDNFSIKKYIASISDSKVIIIVDYENISQSEELKKLTNYVNINNAQTKMSIVKIAGFCSSMKSKADLVVRSNRKDAIDHYISYFVGKIEEIETSPDIYIITRDKFGSCLQDFCEKVCHCSDVDDFIKMYKK